jgi:hypothetical protein
MLYRFQRTCFHPPSRAGRYSTGVLINFGEWRNRYEDQNDIDFYRFMFMDYFQLDFCGLFRRGFERLFHLAGELGSANV